MGEKYNVGFLNWMWFGLFGILENDGAECFDDGYD